MPKSKSKKKKKNKAAALESESPTHVFGSVLFYPMFMYVVIGLTSFIWRTQCALINWMDLKFYFNYFFNPL